MDYGTTPRDLKAHSLTNIFAALDFEEQASRYLDPGTLSYLLGGATDEITLRENVEAFRRVRVRPRLLAGVGTPELRTSVLGTSVAMPICLSPAGANGFFHPEAELAVARAAKRAEILHVLSTVSTRSLEEVAAANAPRWFQLYMHRDRGVCRALIQRAEAAGYSAFVVTADMPVVGRRERECRVGFVFGGHYDGNLRDLGNAEELLAGISNSALTWNDLDWLRTQSKLPIVLKGVLRGEDARVAVEHGVAGILVSNHGARLLDRTPATLNVLSEVVRAVQQRAEVYLDGGVRRGIDAVIAMAMGARAVFMGRPFLLALAHSGEAGVFHLLELLREELREAMALLGLRSTAAVPIDVIANQRSLQ